MSRDRWIEQLRSPEWLKRQEAAIELGRLADSEAFTILAAPDRHESNLVSDVMDGLTKGAPATVGPIISIIERSPSSTAAKLCVLVLGHILFDRGPKADRRIAPTLLRLLRDLAPRGAWEAQYIIASIGGGVDVDPLRDATQELLRILRLSRDEREPYRFALEEAMEILLIWHGLGFLPKLEALTDSLPETHPLTELVRVVQEHGFERRESLNWRLPPNREQWMRQLQSLLKSAKGSAAYGLGKSGDPEVFRILEAGDHYPDVGTNAVDGLIEGAPATIQPMLDFVERTPPSSAVHDCLYALGEISYQQGLQRDPRILPVLLKHLKHAVPRGTKEADHAVHPIRECARATPVREATEDLLRLLEISKTEPDPDGWAIQKAIETLLASEGIGFLPRLQEMAKSFPPKHELVLHLRCVDPENFSGQIDRSLVDE